MPALYCFSFVLFFCILFLYVIYLFIYCFFIFLGCNFLFLYRRLEFSQSRATIAICWLSRAFPILVVKSQKTALVWTLFRQLCLRNKDFFLTTSGRFYHQFSFFRWCKVPDVKQVYIYGKLLLLSRLSFKDNQKVSVIRQLSIYTQVLSSRKASIWF